LTIDDIRLEIDRLDNELLQLFNQRAGLALKVGELKQRLNLPIYDPSREKQIIDKMQANNPGPLDNAAIVRLFERVVDESRNLESRLPRESDDIGCDAKKNAAAAPDRAALRNGPGVLEALKIPDED